MKRQSSSRGIIKNETIAKPRRDGEQAVREIYAWHLAPQRCEPFLAYLVNFRRRRLAGRARAIEAPLHDVFCGYNAIGANGVNRVRKQKRAFTPVPGLKSISKASLAGQFYLKSRSQGEDGRRIGWLRSPLIQHAR